MKNRRWMLAVAVGIGMLAAGSLNGLAQTGNTGKALEGTWKLDNSKSDFGKLAAPKSETIWILSAKANSEKWKLTLVDADGKTVTESYSGAADDKFYAMPGDPEGATFAFTKSGGWQIKDKAGKIVETGTPVVSDGGKTLTLKAVRHLPDGDVTTTQVYTKSM